MIDKGILVLDDAVRGSCFLVNRNWPRVEKINLIDLTVDWRKNLKDYNVPFISAAQDKNFLYVYTGDLVKINKDTGDSLAGDSDVGSTATRKELYCFSERLVLVSDEGIRVYSTE